MAPWSGVQILGRDSNGPIVTCMLNSLNSLPLDIDASLDVAGKKPSAFLGCAWKP